MDRTVISGYSLHPKARRTVLVVLTGFILLSLMHLFTDIVPNWIYSLISIINLLFVLVSIAPQLKIWTKDAEKQ